jgi:hypothetical protein
VITEQELKAEMPIVVQIDAQEIGLMYATRTTPYEFAQYLLSKLRAVGGPVEGTLRLSLTHGGLYKMRESPDGPGCFDYTWLPPAWQTAMNEQGGIMPDTDPRGVKLEVRA